MGERLNKLREKIKTPIGYVTVATIAAFASVLIYAGAQYVYQRENASSSSAMLDSPAAAQLGPESGLLRKTSESFRLVAKKVGPAVVNIKSTKNPKGRVQQMPGRGGRRRGIPPQQQPDEDGGQFGGRDPFFDFFERFGQPFPFPQQESPQTSMGSGILIDKAGHVVTNNHVIEGGTDIIVTLGNDKNKTDIKAKIIGTDPKTDLAVLKLESTKNLPEPAKWADFNTVEVGDWSIAIGSPFALGQSVTVGIVSAKGERNSLALTGAEFGGDLIQTDAAINPGNSGGPLCDLEGNVMGVNTAIYTRSGGYMGIGFAIPSSVAKEVSSKLIQDGKITRGWLGVFIQPLNEGLARDLGIKEGVGIHEVVEDSPAAKAGLRAGDVVVKVDGKAVKEVGELQKIISGYKPAQTVQVEVIAYDTKKRRTVTVKIGELPDNVAQSGGESGEGTGEPDKLGLLVSPLKNRQGIQVDAVEPGSLAAEQLGIEPGDILVRFNRQPLDSLSTYKKLLGSAKQVYLEVKRKGRTLFYQFVMPQ